MGRHRWHRLPVALAVALLVNVAGLSLMVQVNQIVTRAEPDAGTRETVIQLQEPPKKQRPRRVRRQIVKLETRAAPMPLPELPSTLSASALPLPGIGGVDLLGDLMRQDQGLKAELILKEDAVDEPPRVLSRAAPRYPRRAEDRGIEGYVVFKLQVSRQGTVERVWVDEAEPPGVFEAAAERAIRQYRFAPARYRGQPVAVLCRQRMVFQLED